MKQFQNKISLIISLFLFFAFSATYAQADIEGQKIEKLIQFIANLKDATFIRNGEEYSAKDAASHLRMKKEKAGSKVKTAKDFIEKIASKSSFSGKPYQIRWKNGNTQNVGEILMAELKKIEATK